MAVKLGDYVETSYGGDSGSMSAINGRYHRFQRELGRGAYKCVYHAYDTVDGVDVAWNSIDIDSLPNDAERDKIMREVEMLNGLKHAHILRIRDYWLDPLRHQLCFVTDIIQSGSLRRFIHDREVSLGSVKKWSRQILDALAYLHSREPSVIHRDIKCDNIFIDGPTGNVTIGDLGLSTHFASEAMNKGLSLVGTPEFMAPELYTEKYDVKVDIYAFGMCVLEMITKQYPYEEVDNPVALYRTVCDRVQPRALGTINRPSVRAFVEFCVEFDPFKRPTAQECLDHPFLFYHDSHLDRMPCAKLVGGQASPSKRAHVPRKLPTIRESRPRDTLSKHPSGQVGDKSTGTGRKNKSQSKLPYVYDCSAKFGDEKRQSVSVRLKLNLSGNNATRVAFQYNPRTESVQTVVADMVHKLNLDPNRVDEIVNVIDKQVGKVVNNEKYVISETQVKKSMRLEIADLAKLDSPNSNTDQSESAQGSTTDFTAEHSTEMLTVLPNSGATEVHPAPTKSTLPGLTTSSPQHICVPTESSVGIQEFNPSVQHQPSLEHVKTHSSLTVPTLSVSDESISDAGNNQSAGEVGTPSSVKSEGGKSAVSISAVPALPQAQPTQPMTHLPMQPPTMFAATQFGQHPGMGPTMIAQYPYPVHPYSYRMAVPMSSYSEPPSSHGGTSAAVNLHVTQQPSVMPTRPSAQTNPTAAASSSVVSTTAPTSAAIQPKSGLPFSSQLKSETLDDSMLIETMAELKKIPSLNSDDQPDNHGSGPTLDSEVEMPPPLVMIPNIKSTDSRKSDQSVDIIVKDKPNENDSGTIPVFGGETNSLTQSCDDLISENMSKLLNQCDELVPAEEKGDCLQDKLEDLYTEKTKVYKEAVETEKSRLEDPSHRKELGSAQVELRKKLRGIDKQISALKKKGVKRKKSTKKDGNSVGSKSITSHTIGDSAGTVGNKTAPSIASKTGSTSSFEEQQQPNQATTTAAAVIAVSPNNKQSITDSKHQKSPNHKANSSSPINMRDSLGGTNELIRFGSAEPGRNSNGAGLSVPAPPQPSRTETETVSGFSFPHGSRVFPLSGMVSAHSGGAASEDSSSSLFHNGLFSKHHGEPPAAFTPPSEIALLLVGDYMKRFPSKLSLSIPSNLKPDISSPYNDALEKAHHRLTALSKQLKKKYEYYKSDIAELMTVYSERGLSEMSVDRCVEKVEDMKRTLEELFHDVVADQIDLVDRTRQLKILAQSVVAQQSFLNQAAAMPSASIVSTAHSPSAAATVGGYFDQPISTDSLPPSTGLRLSRSQQSLNGLIQGPSTGGTSGGSITPQIPSGQASMPPGMISAPMYHPSVAPFGAHYAFMPPMNQGGPPPQVMYYTTTQMTHPSMQNCVTPRNSMPVTGQASQMYAQQSGARLPVSQHTSMPMTSVGGPSLPTVTSTVNNHHVSPPASVASESTLIAESQTVPTMEGIPQQQ